MLNAKNTDWLKKKKYYYFRASRKTRQHTKVTDDYTVYKFQDSN